MGALPSALLTGVKSGPRTQGFASLKQHYQCRLTTAGMGTSNNPAYITHAFDVMANVALRGYDTRLILHRGFIDSQGATGLKMRNEDDVFYTDSIDNRQIVNNLSSAERYYPSTYFITGTCNQSHQFGIRNIKKWIDSDGPLENFPHYHELLPQEKDEVKKAIQQSAGTLILRNWMEVRKIIFKYIAESPEKPLGTVDLIWFRDENQETVGNLPHVHGLLKIKEDKPTPEGRAFIESKIQASIADLIPYNRLQELITKGLLSSQQDYFDTIDLASKILMHHCSDRCMRRYGPNPEDLKCRVPDNRRITNDHTRHCRISHDPNHSHEAMNILAQLGLCKDPYHPESESLHFCPLHPLLVTERHVPPTRPGEGIISPCNTELFLWTRSAYNIQICTTGGTARYLAKYIAKIDKNNSVALAVDSKNANTLHAASTFIHNSKITSSAFNEKLLLDASRNKHHPRGRAISTMEQLQLLLGHPQVHTTMKFVVIPTRPLEERSGVDRVAPVQSLRRDEEINGNEPPNGPTDLLNTEILSFSARRHHHLAAWRQHSATEMLIIKDIMFAPISMDNITLFAVRPPELRFVQKPALYHRWFERSAVQVKDLETLIHMLNTDTLKSTWLDGVQHVVKVRRAALSDIVNYLNSNNDPSNGRSCMKRLFVTIQNRALVFENMPHEQQLAIEGLGHDSIEHQHLQQWIELKELFISKKCLATASDTHLLPIPVFSNIKPTLAGRFLLHLLLSMGDFNNEIELLAHPTMREAFQHANLIEFPTDLTRSADILLKKYILEQVAFYPGGTPSFDRYVVAASTCIHQAIVHNSIPITDMPPSLYTALCEHTTDEVANHCQILRQRLINALNTELHTLSQQNDAPTFASLMNGTITRQQPHDWNGSFQRYAQQTLLSYEEQCIVQQHMKQQLDHYLAASLTQTKCFCIAGSPGCGKTFLLLLGAMYALSKGLKVATTALMAERALSLGGVHLHKLFRIPVNQNGTVQRLAEQAVVTLLKDPKSLGFLCQLDVLCLDEIGQISSEMLSVLDIILRRIRPSTVFCGGLLIITTLDPKQLQPVNGHPVLTSPHVLSSFEFRKLTQSVRASGDLALQRIQDIARMMVSSYVSSPEVLQEFRQLLGDHCTFVDSWDDPCITTNVFRLFGKHAAALAAETAFLHKVQVEHGAACIACHAEDLQSAIESHGQWQPASPQTSRMLSRKLKERKILYFYPNGVYEMTYNKDGHFSTSQLALLIQSPTQQHVDNFLPVPILLAPEGVKHVPLECTDRGSLLAHGWRDELVDIAPLRSQSLSYASLRATRKQYGMKHHVSSTIHASMGHTLGIVATSISTTIPRYKLWEKEQAVVLLSRTKNAGNIIFVGNKNDTLDALVMLIQTRTQFAEYMEHILNVLTRTANNPVSIINHTTFPFRVCDVRLPEDNSGYCYILLSLQQQGTIYIGQTLHLGTRLAQHNSGFGGKQTSPAHLRPWALLAYVAGFQQNRQNMLSFESDWKTRAQAIVAQGGAMNMVMEIAHSAPFLIETLYEHLTLVFVITGTIGVHNPPN